MSTQTPEPPVRFYKVIALSFLFLTIVLLGVVIFITSKKATVTVLTKQDPKSITLTAAVGGNSEEKVVNGTVNTTEFFYSKEFSPTGNAQVEDVAKGTVTLINKTGTTQPLVKTTRLLSKDGVLFRLENSVVIPAGKEIAAAVYADQKGSGGNIGPTSFTIPGLSAEKQKVIYAESKEPFTGGTHTVGVLSADDITNAKAEFEKKAEQAYLATLSASSEGTERLVATTDRSTSVDHAVGETVGTFRVSGTSTIVVVEYKNSDLANLIASESASKIDPKSERYLSLTNKPKVTVQKIENGVATLSVLQEVAVTLDANSELLSPDHFAGKSKDEIERYILGLDHVQGVDVKFSPSWVMSAPSSYDRISVVVKNIK
jgi:hypothetical protein